MCLPPFPPPAAGGLFSSFFFLSAVSYVSSFSCVDETTREGERCRPGRGGAGREAQVAGPGPRPRPPRGAAPAARPATGGGCGRPALTSAAGQSPAPAPRRRRRRRAGRIPVKHGSVPRGRPCVRNAAALLSRQTGSGFVASMDVSSDPYLPYDGGGGDGIPLRELHKRGMPNLRWSCSFAYLDVRDRRSGSK